MVGRGQYLGTEAATIAAQPFSEAPENLSLGSGNVMKIYNGRGPDSPRHVLRSTTKTTSFAPRNKMVVRETGRVSAHKSTTTYSLARDKPGNPSETLGSRHHRVTGDGQDFLIHHETIVRCGTRPRCSTSPGQLRWQGARRADVRCSDLASRADGCASDERMTTEPSRSTAFAQTVSVARASQAAGHSNARGLFFMP